MHADYGIFVYTIWPLFGAAPLERDLRCRVHQNAFWALQDAEFQTKIPPKGHSPNLQLQFTNYKYDW